jgi:hypothetical protein
MPRWLWAVAALEAACTVFWIVRGGGHDVWVAFAAATCGGVLGFALRDWRATIDAGSTPEGSTESRVFVATAVKDGNVVQESVVADDRPAAKRIAADHWRLQPEEVDAAELVEKVLRR